MVSPKSGLSTILRLPEPDASPTPPQEGTEVVVYGAKRRGANGVVVIGSSELKGKISKKGDIGISSKADSGESVSYGNTSLTDDGDCGALYLVTTSGSPFAMHHCLQNPQDERGKNTDKTKGYISFGIPLAKVLSKHTLLGAFKRGSTGTATVFTARSNRETDSKHGYFQDETIGQNTNDEGYNPTPTTESQHREIQNPSNLY